MGKSGRYHGVTGGGGSTGFMPHGVGGGGFVGLADLKWEIFRVATYPFMVLGGYQGVCNQTMPQGVGHFCGLFWRPKFENSCISLQLAGWGEGGGEGFTLIPALFQGKPYSTLGSWALEMYFLPTRLYYQEMSTCRLCSDGALFRVPLFAVRRMTSAPFRGLQDKSSCADITESGD